MLEKTITLTYSREGNSYIDYLKGMSIVFVILTHSLYPIKDKFLFNLWGMQAVPLFLIISSALYFRNGVPTTFSFHFGKLFSRIIRPYFIFSLVLSGISIFVGKDTVYSAVVTILHDGGMGPGGYYVPLYVQYFLLLPLFAILIRKSTHPFFVTISVSIVLEILANHYLPMWIYRLSIIRYLPLLYAGYYWAQKGIRLNVMTLFLSLFSAVALLILTYSGWRFNPLFCTFHPWEYANWVCYAYPTFLLAFCLHVVYKCNFQSVNNFLQSLGKDSFEIYMMQMAVFYFFPIEYFQEHFINLHPVFVYAFCSIVTMIASIAPVIIYKSIKRYNAL